MKDKGAFGRVPWILSRKPCRLSVPNGPAPSTPLPGLGQIDLCGVLNQIDPLVCRASLPGGLIVLGEDFVHANLRVIDQSVGGLEIGFRSGSIGC